MPRSSILLAIALALACANQSSDTGGATSELSSGRGYTLVNLHPDNGRSRLYAVNFQQSGLVPVCSEVEYLGLGRKSGFGIRHAFKFRVVATNRDYEYLNHKAAAERFPNS